MDALIEFQQEPRHTAIGNRDTLTLAKEKRHYDGVKIVTSRMHSERIYHSRPRYLPTRHASGFNALQGFAIETALRLCV